MSLGPLSGFTIGVTADRRADEEVDLLVGSGAECLRAAVGGDVARDAEDAANADRLVRAVLDGRVDAVTFTARAAVDGLFGFAGVNGVRDDVGDAFETDVVPVCIGPLCARALTDVGVRDPLVPARPGLVAMVEVVTDHFAARARVVELAGTDVRVQGRLALVDGGPEAWLTDRERAILDALIERPGVVLSKRDLLRRVWRGSDRDEHVVEVTIARLRHRLGPAAAGIETVMRRGYRASPT